MSNIWAFVIAHQVLSTTFVMAVWSTFVGSLDAPTANDGRGYRMLFKFCNGFAFNFQRALNTSVESSPNFQAALDKQTNRAGQSHIEAVVPVPAIPIPEDKP